MKINFQYGRSKADIEKAVFPALIFCYVPSPEGVKHGYSGASISAGWWDWFIRMVVFWPNNPQGFAKPNEQPPQAFVDAKKERDSGWPNDFPPPGEPSP